MLKEELESLQNSEVTISDFEDPNWAYKQAFRNGEKTARIQILKEYLNFIQD